MTKASIGCNATINLYPLVVRAIEEGVAYGWNRAHKHTDTPDAEMIKMQIEEGVINALCEFINFSGDE